MRSSKLCLGELFAVADVVDGSVTPDGWVGLTVIRRAEQADVSDPESDRCIADSDADGFLIV